MSYVSYYSLALSIVNLLLLAAGLLLVFFDWSAARRREFLYIYFNEEKPGFNYFAAARRRRAQYTRLLIAFGILFIGGFLSVIMSAVVSPLSEWSTWIVWWNANWHLPPHWTAAVELAAGLELWVIFIASLGICLLALGFLHHSSHEHANFIDYATLGYIAVWALFAAGVISGIFGESTFIIANIAMLCMILIVVASVMAHVSMHLKESPKPGLLAYNPMMLGVCFVLLWIGMWGRYIFKNPAWTPFFDMLGFIPIVGMVAKGVLNEYELVEMSRHRLGRERQTVVTFLRRIGSAFTTAMDLEKVLHLILESALETTDAASGAIYLYNKDTDLLEPRDVVNFFPPLYTESAYARATDRTENLAHEMKRQAFRLGEGVLGEVAEQGQACIINDVQASGIMIGGTTEYLRNRSMLVVPLRIREEPLGVMAVLCKQRGSFENEDRLLLRALADQGAIFINNAILADKVAEQERLQRDLQIARDIQHRLLPESCPEVEGYEIVALGSAATEVGGDYYDFFWTDEDHLAFVVADVSGKGVHAALIAAMVRSVFRTQAKGNPDVRSALCLVNDFIGKDMRSDMFVTCTYGILNIKESTFEWGRAGHEPLVVAHHSGETDVSSPNGFALGVVPSPDFGELLEVEKIQLQSGDRILLFTDGLTEAMNANGEEFGMQRIIDVLEGREKVTTATDAPLARPALTRSAATLPVQGLSAQYAEGDLWALEREVAHHVGNAAQSDDLTIVYIRVK